MALILISSRFAEQVNRATNTDKFYMVCVWEDVVGGLYSAEVLYGRRGSSPQSKEYYGGPSRASAERAASAKWSEKTGEGYVPNAIVQSGVQDEMRRRALRTLPLPAKPAAAPRAATTSRSAAPAPSPAAPAPVPVPVTPVYQPVMPPLKITAIGASEIARWQAALVNPDYVPVQGLNPGIAGLVRAYLVFDVATNQRSGWCKLLTLEPDPTKPAGSWRGSPTPLVAESRALLSRLDPVNKICSDTVIEAWVMRDPAAPTMTVADILRLEGRDMRTQPWASRGLALEQVYRALKGANQVTSEWSMVEQLPRARKAGRADSLWLRRLDSTYDPSDSGALLRKA
jgi:predicted DNA-binding WGR domain protein